MNPVERILGRSEDRYPISGLAAWLEGKVAVVTGAGGCLGGRVVRRLAALPLARLIAVDQAEAGLHELELELGTTTALQVRVGSSVDPGTMERVCAGRVDLLVHAAAHKHVPLMEAWPREALRNNVVGTDVVLRAARSSRVERVVFVSSDKAACPVGVLGATKRIGERLMASLPRAGTETVSVRLANVVDSPGSVVPLFRRQLDDGRPLTVVAGGASRHLMSVDEATELILHAAAEGTDGCVVGPAEHAPVPVRLIAERVAEGAETDFRWIEARPGDAAHERLFAADEAPRKLGRGPARFAMTAAEDASSWRGAIARLEALDDDELRVQLGRLAALGAGALF